MTKQFSSAYFLPKYLKDYPLYKHLIPVLDLILNSEIFTFKTTENLNEVLTTFFGANLTEEQQESVLLYYKVFVEPNIGTIDAIEKLFKILNINAKVVVWYKNIVPLPPYKFNLEFPETPENLNFRLIIDLINLVKNERSHLASVKNENSPDIAVWDYSYWDAACWDSPFGIVIDGVTFNLVKSIVKHYNTGFNIVENRGINTTYEFENKFKTNRNLNDDLLTNFDPDPYTAPKFSVQEFSMSDIPIKFETTLIGDFDNNTFESSSVMNRFSVAKQLVHNYDPSIIAHINPYCTLGKNRFDEILSIRNRGSNEFYFSSKQQKPFEMDKIQRYKGDPTIRLNHIELQSPNLEQLLPNTFSVFGVFKFNNLTSSLRTLVRGLHNTFNLEVSLTSVKISNGISQATYSLGTASNNWQYFYIDQSTIRIGSFIQNISLSIKANDQLIIGDDAADLNLSTVIFYNKSLTPSELATNITRYF